MATEQMAQMFPQLQQLSQQLVNQQQMFQQGLEMQRQQSQAQMETRDFQTNALAKKKKGFKADEKAWPDWRYKFRVEASRSFRSSGGGFGLG